MDSKPIIPKPPWLKRRLPAGSDFETVRTLVEKGGLHTVCQEARCPNIWECFSRRTATFLLMGSRCTRNCSFCAVTSAAPQPLDPDEPRRVAEAAASMALTYVVITSVTRDDLPDGGAAHFAATIQAVRRENFSIRIEVLIPDFMGCAEALEKVLRAGPDVLNHNLETVPRLYATVRPQADYRRSLKLLERAGRSEVGPATKSGLMLGIGETAAEIGDTLKDLRQVDCRMVTLGQYLQPSPAHLAVERYVTPEEFDRWRDTALEMGFAEVASGPFVRSSYHAGEMYHRSHLE